jgi:hypothetical protein
MKHLKIFENYVNEFKLPSETSLVKPEIDLLDTESGIEGPGKFQTESTDFTPTSESEDGDYLVNFINSEGKETTAVIGHAIDPEYVGKKMISSIEMVPDSSSDGKEYYFIGYYDEIPGSDGAYELVKVLIEE